MWNDSGSRAWSTTAFTDYDQLSPYVNFVICGTISASAGFFNPYASENYLMNEQSYININYEY